MAPKNWKLGKGPKRLQLRVFDRQVGPKLKKLKGFFPGGECGGLVIKKSE